VLIGLHTHGPMIVERAADGLDLPVESVRAACAELVSIGLVERRGRLYRND
jgi:predicted ArsR family transcriptional regulator